MARRNHKLRTAATQSSSEKAFGTEGQDATPFGARRARWSHQKCRGELNPVAPPPELAPSAFVLEGGKENEIRWRSGERLHNLFEERVDQLARAGDLCHVAVASPDGDISYAELERRANQLARYLVKKGVKPGDTVGLLFDRSWWSYAAMLAVTKSGAAYVPLDRAFPADRLAFIVNDACIGTVLTTSVFRHHLSALPCPVLALDIKHKKILSERFQTLQTTCRAQEGGCALLHCVHVGFDRQAQGCCRLPFEHLQLHKSCGRSLWDSAFGPRVPGHDYRLRFLDRRDMGSAVFGSDARPAVVPGRPAGTGFGSVSPVPPGHRTLLRANASRHDGRRTSRSPFLARFWRSLPAPSCGPLAQRKSNIPERLRADRGDRHRDMDATRSNKARHHWPTAPNLSNRDPG